MIGETYTMTITRRQFGAVSLGALITPALGQAQTVGGVRIGVQTYSFRELPRAAGRDATASIIEAMKTCGLTECELWSPQIEPAAGGGRGLPPEDVRQAREALRNWRLNERIEYFNAIRQAFATAGLSIYAFNYSFGNDFTDDEIERGFVMGRALGAEIITASTNLTVARRVVPFADRHRMIVSMHNHSEVRDPNEFATPQSFAAAVALSKYFKVNLDIGHFTAANYDPVAYIRDHHADITNLHIKDRKRDQGDHTPWGRGDTRIGDVLTLLKRERWPIRAYIEYEYHGDAGAVEEVKKCAAFMKAELA
jgi:sugar phosphate isomerase/epimerase